MLLQLTGIHVTIFTIQNKFVIKILWIETHLKDSCPGVSITSNPGNFKSNCWNYRKKKMTPFISIHVFEISLFYFKKICHGQDWNQKNDFSSNMLSKTNICTFFTSLTILVCSQTLSTGILVAPICWVIPPASPSCTFVRRIWKMWATSIVLWCHSFYLGSILKLPFSYYLN